MNSKALFRCFSVGLISFIWAVGCIEEEELSEVGNVDPNNIVDVLHTPVERQSIGNCWLYAVASWAESVNYRATGVPFDVSQSYWTYLHWFDQIVSGNIKDDAVSTGGHWSTARNIIRRYGLMAEKDFVYADTFSEMSSRQLQANKAIDRELGPGGRLETPEQRQDRVLVKTVLDQVWALDVGVKETLDTVFGPDLSNTFLGTAQSEGSVIVSPREFAVAYTTARMAGDPQLVSTHLEEALWSWSQVTYPSSPAQRRSFQIRVQKALHEKEPVIVSWFVDFNAMEYDNTHGKRGSFNLQTLEEAGGPGGQGGHMTVFEDYEAVIPGIPNSVVETGSVARGQWVHYEPFAIGEGETLTVDMTGTNDADLYVRKNEQPNSGQYDCRPYRSGSAERCTVTGPAQVHVAVNGYASTSDYRLEFLTPTQGEVLKAGITLDPNDPEDKGKLSRALDPSAQIVFFRIKNSWGGPGRPSLPFANGPLGGPNGAVEMGYHDIYMDYLHGPIAKEDHCTPENCPKTIVPFSYVILPPGF
jgi:hypothetical protein